MSDSSFTHNAVLLYGPRKAGTSLLHNLLDGGSTLLMMPSELKFTARLRKGTTADELPRRYLEEGRLDFRSLIRFDEKGRARANPEFHFEGLSHQQTRELFDLEGYVAELEKSLQGEPQSYNAIIRHDVQAFYNALRSRPEYSCWAAKEVGGAPANVVNFFHSHFPGGKVVCLARDPRFIVRSIILDRKRKGIALNTRQVWTECAKAQGVLDFLYTVIGREIVVNYEKLTSQTETEMRRVCGELKIPFEPIFTQPTALGVPVVVRTSSQKTTQVFRQGENWRANLSRGHAACIRAFFQFAPFLHRRRGRACVSYEDFLAKLERAQ